MNNILHKFKRILIANRGEIAVRIINTAKKMGIETVAIYTKPEEKALHVLNADIKVLMHGNSLLDTYLNQSLIINIAKQYFADAIHPGYGFLSENGDFAELCEKNLIKFIGPSSDLIKKMGNKDEANKIAYLNKVPLLNKIKGDVDDMLESASKLEFPLIVKAAAGGGGKGMRVVYHKDELKEAINKASSEAKRYFDNDSVYIEQYIQNPRHIEVQILGDHHGNIIHLYERDCSVQRRHQKIIEEAPAPNLPEEIRKEIIDDALKIAKNIGYTNAGTIEFILTPSMKHYFLEMNTRIQVEHTVTEEITGIDIVEQQLLIAMGEKLEVAQDDITINGHAIEIRLYAEDANNNYLPSHGIIERLYIPNIPGIRVDNGVNNYEEIQTHFDSLLKKVTSHASTREEAITNLDHFLKEYVLFGLETNRDVILFALNNDHFKKGKYSTSFISDNAEVFQSKREFSLLELKILSSAYILIKYNSANSNHNYSFWRNNPLHQIFINNKIITIEVLHTYSNEYIIQIDNNEVINLRITNLDENHLCFISNDIQYKINYLRSADRNIYIQYNGKKLIIEDKPQKVRKASMQTSVEQKTLVSPTPGNIIDIMVKEGQNVKKGDPLMILEAMKTENTLTAWKDTTIAKISVNTGDHVSLKQSLLETY